jgi:hypothetical protein
LIGLEGVGVDIIEGQIAVKSRYARSRGLKRSSCRLSATSDEVFSYLVVLQLITILVLYRYLFLTADALDRMIPDCIGGNTGIVVSEEASKEAGHELDQQQEDRPFFFRRGSEPERFRSTIAFYHRCPMSFVAAKSLLDDASTTNPPLRCGRPFFLRW